MLSGREQATTIVEALRLGAADYVIAEATRKGSAKSSWTGKSRAPSKSAARVRRSRITAAAHRRSGSRVSSVGRQLEMQRIASVIEQVADSDVTVLIRGESGVGRGACRARHPSTVLRKPRPFVKVNCAACPTSCWKASSSATRRAPSPGRRPRASESSRTGRHRDDLPG